jgi:DNA uptake protein ComE-like DNA-binding protein
MLLAYRGADDDLSGRQADQAIEGAVRYAESLLTNLERPGGFPDLISYGSEAMLVGDATFWFLGRADQTGTGLTRDFGLIDEASKLNLNTTPFNLLKELPGMTEEVAAAIVDWCDADENITPGGAESETYMRRQPGYSCKNAPFESIEELALVNGVTREILYGEDANMNGVLDPNEDDGDKTPPSDNADGKLDRGILEYVTVFSSEPKTRSDGTTPRIDVGKDPQLEQSLETMLTETLGDAARAKKIIDPLRPMQPLPSPLGFYIISTQRGGNDAMTAAEFDQIAVNLTMTPSPGGPPTFYPSPVNVNTASEAVLACIPGILDKASALVAARLNRSQQDSGLAWVVDALGNPALAQTAGPFITGQSWQISADIAAVGRYGRGYRRTKCVIDNSTATPRIIYRRNLAPLGWALGSDIRQSFALRKERL